MEELRRVSLDAFIERVRGLAGEMAAETLKSYLEAKMVGDRVRIDGVELLYLMLTKAGISKDTAIDIFTSFWDQSDVAAIVNELNARSRVERVRAFKIRLADQE